MACPALRPRHALSYHRQTASSSIQQKSTSPCKFWLQGRCSRSQSCPFSHVWGANTSAAPPPRSSCWRRTNSSTTATQQEVEKAAPFMAAPAEKSAVDSTTAALVSASREGSAITAGAVASPTALEPAPQEGSAVTAVHPPTALEPAAQEDSAVTAGAVASPTALEPAPQEVSAVTAVGPPTALEPAPQEGSAATAAISPPTALELASSQDPRVAPTLGAATGISAVNWPIMLVTGEDGSIGLDDLERPTERRTMHKLHADITCVVDGPVQQLLHPNLLLLGLASGEIAAIFNLQEQHQRQLAGGIPVVQIIPGPPQPCGKVLCIVSARTCAHSLLLIAGYENGAILCWNFDAAAGAYSPLCALQHPTGSSIVSLDVSDDEDFGDVSSVGQKKHLLYSASSTVNGGCITVWNLDTFSRLQVLLRPGASITKLLTAGRYLFSGCTNGSIEVWGPSTAAGASESQEMELQYTQLSPRQAATAVVDLCGTRMEGGSHLLFAAYSDDTVSMFELPSFKELQRVPMSFGIRAMDVGTRRPDGRAVLLLAGTNGWAVTCVI